jgi:acyl-CoA dehydrogenase
LVASGFHCIPLPLPETLLACSLLEQAGIEPPEGPIGVADQPAGTPISLERSGAGWRVDGELAHVPWGRHCKHVTAQVAHAGEVYIVLLATEGLDIRSNLNLAREPRDTFLLRDARPVRVSRSPFAQPDHIRLYGALLRSAQTAGAARRTLEQAIQYAGDRVQFGRPLAKFQAVQQQIAMAVSEVAAITAAADHACEAATSGDPACAVAIAKITAADGPKATSQACHWPACRASPAP